MANATGWTELFEGNLLGAAFNMYDFFLNGWTIGVLFFVFQAMLFLKTRNLTLVWVSGLFFASMYAASVFIKAASMQFMFLILVLELAGVIYMLVFK